MRIAGLAGLALVAAIGTGAAEERIYFTPENAIHECLAEAKEAVEEKFDGAASAAGDFAASETDGGWTVDGTFRVGEGGSGRTVSVSCSVTADGTEVTTADAGD